MTYKIVVEAVYYQRNADGDHGYTAHVNNVDLPHTPPQEFKDKFKEETGKEPSYAAYKDAVIQGILASFAGEGKYVVLASDDGNEHIMLDREDIDNIKVRVVKTLDKV